MKTRFAVVAWAVLAGCGPAGIGPEVPTDAGTQLSHFARVVTSSELGRSPSFTVFAYFFSPGVDCERQSVGPCITERCPATGARTQSSAGTIAVSGGLLPVTLLPDATGGYGLRHEEGQRLFKGAETITVSATGAQVPAFSATVVAPTPVVLTAAWMQPAPDPVPIDTHAPLTFTWANHPNDELKLQLDGPSRLGGMAVSAICVFPTSAGVGVIPTSVLGLFGAGDGFITTGVQNITWVDVPPWKVELIALTNAVDADGWAVGGRVHFE